MRELVVEVYGYLVGVDLLKKQVDELKAIDSQAAVPILLNTAEGVCFLEVTGEVSEIEGVEAEAVAFKVVVDTHTVEEPERIGREHDSAADILGLGTCFIDGAGNTLGVQAESQSQAGNAGADDGDFVGHIEVVDGDCDFGLRLR